MPVDPIDIVRTRPEVWPAIETIARANMADADPQSRYGAQVMMAKMASAPPAIAYRAYGLMQQGVADSDPRVQQAALFSIGQIARQHPLMVPSIYHDLKRTLNSPDRDVGLTSLRICTVCSEAAPHLASLFRGHVEAAADYSQSPHVRDMAARMLRETSSAPSETPAQPVLMQTPRGVVRTTGAVPTRKAALGG